MRRDVFQAIADPTRRAIISVLAQHSLNLNSVARHFEVSRPAISRHIKILTECGLIEIKNHGRERFCIARLGQLNEVSSWVEQYQRYWNAKLDALETYLAQMNQIDQADAGSKEKKKLKSGSKQKTKKKNIARNSPSKK